MQIKQPMLMPFLQYYLNCRSQTPELASQETEDLFDEGSVEKAELQTGKPPETNLPAICLKQVFPKFSKQFTYLRLVERIAALFIRFLGVRGTTKLGPTSFRTFVRSGALLRKHL